MTTLAQTCRACPTAARRHPALFVWIAAHRQRRVLARLDDAALRDIGLSRSDVVAEMRRPFWDIS